jgi:hypothetical protein
MLGCGEAVGEGGGVILTMIVEFVGGSLVFGD